MLLLPYRFSTGFLIKQPTFNVGKPRQGRQDMEIAEDSIINNVYKC